MYIRAWRGIVGNVEIAILKQRVIPSIVLFGLLPRSVFYVFRADAFVYMLISFFAILALLYLTFRYTTAIKYIDNKILIVLDSLCFVVGMLLACVFGYNGSS